LKASPVCNFRSAGLRIIQENLRPYLSLLAEASQQDCRDNRLISLVYFWLRVSFAIVQKTKVSKHLVVKFLNDDFVFWG